MPDPVAGRHMVGNQPPAQIDAAQTLNAAANAKRFMEKSPTFRSPQLQLTRADIRILSQKGHGSAKQNG